MLSLFLKPTSLPSKYRLNVPAVVSPRLVGTNRTMSAASTLPETPGMVPAAREGEEERPVVEPRERVDGELGQADVTAVEVDRPGPIRVDRDDILLRGRDTADRTVLLDGDQQLDRADRQVDRDPHLAEARVRGRDDQGRVVVAGRQAGRVDSHVDLPGAVGPDGPRQSELPTATGRRSGSSGKPRLG